MSEDIFKDNLATNCLLYTQFYFGLWLIYIFFCKKESFVINLNLELIQTMVFCPMYIGTFNKVSTIFDSKLIQVCMNKNAIYFYNLLCHASRNPSKALSQVIKYKSLLLYTIYTIPREKSLIITVAE